MNCYVRLKNKNGITLIALVITIIVLLILAGVSLNMLLGENGILTKVKTAKGSQERAGLKEEAQLTMLSLETEKLTSDDSKSFKEVLESGISGATIEAVNATESSSGLTDVYYVLKGGDYVTVYEDGEVLEGKVEIWDGSSINSPEFKKENNIWNWYIYTPSQLKFLADFVNNGDGTNIPESLTSLVESAGYTASDIKMTTDTTIYLMNDIDLGARHANGELIAGTAWTPIGMDYTNVQNKLGTFDGNNHSIRGVYVNIDGSYIGLFGISNGLKNLKIQNSYVKGTGYDTGGIAGYSYKSIESCHNINTIVYGKSYVGGIVGCTMSSGNITGCSNTGEIQSSEVAGGGIVGLATPGVNINNCSNSGNVNVVQQVSGGIVGLLYSAEENSSSISQCNNTGSISGLSCIGGIAGLSSTNSSISKCLNEGTISGIGGNGIGGIVGVLNAKGSINDSSNNGIVTGESYVGGIVGSGSPGNIIENCINNGKVTGNDTYIGGIIGLLSTDSKDPSDREPPVVKNSVNKGKVKGKQDTGGIIGTAAQYNSMIEKCYNLAEIEGTGVNTGGIAGELGRSSKTNHCYNTGLVTGTGNVGGIVGRTYYSIGQINNSYNIGQVKGTSNIGGLLGLNTNSSNAINSYYLEGTASLDIGNNTASDCMKNKEFITTIFVETANTGEIVWEINENKNNGFPVLINSND